MTNQEIYDLIARFDASGLQTLRVSRGDFTIELGKGGAAGTAPAAAAMAATPAASPAAPAKGSETVITAPLVGTFYAAPAPEQPPFVQPGEPVKKGQTVCLLEAMKTIGELAAFGEALMRYTPC